LAISRDETAWMMLHKLRRAMVAPEREPLRGEIEADEFLLGGFEERMGGRQRGKKTLVGIAVKVRGRGSRCLRLQVLSDASGDSLGAFVSSTTATGAIVHTDGWSGHKALPKLGYDHRPRSQRAEPGEHLLPRAHRAVYSLKAWLHAAHRRASPEHMPSYLDEVVFRHNRRGTPHAAFQTLLGISARHSPTTYRQIIDRAA
jgi:hypothetical protein